MLLPAMVVLTSVLLAWLIIGRVVGPYLVRSDTGQYVELSVILRMELLKLSSPVRRPVLWTATWLASTKLKKRPNETGYIGYKWAFIRMNTKDELSLRRYGFQPSVPSRSPSWSRLHYGVEAQAKCAAKGGHIGNENSIADCTCGFYALKAPWLLGQLPGCYGDWCKAYQRAAVLLKVELQGEVIGGHYGYRGRHQRVLDIRLPRRCLVSTMEGRPCRRRVTGLSRRGDGELLVPACAEHEQLSLTEARNRLQTEVAVA